LNFALERPIPLSLPKIVHDIEYGYGDPLRIKVIPDFSLRFVDENYVEANKTIEEGIKQTMLSYFQKRKSDLAQKGLFALHNSFAAIYYIPFQCGMSLHFRFAGQSIPNRSTVKDSKGVKIYFDPVSTTNRLELIKQLASKVLQQPSLSHDMSAVDDIVYHVAAHEFGHAIYGLGHLEKVIPPAIRSLLEEPRAELTSLVTMKLLFEANKISLDDLKKHQIHFALGGLRRFASFDHSATRPYTISAIDTYRTYQQTSFLKLEQNRLHFHLDKVMENMKEFLRQYEEILDAEDAFDSAKIQLLLENMQKETEVTKWLVAQLS